MKRYVMDEIDHQILDTLIDNARTPFTDIAKKLNVSAGTIHVRVKKMEDEGIIKGATLSVDYEKMGYSFIAHIGIFLDKTMHTQRVLDSLENIPFVTVAYVTAGKYNIFAKIRARDTQHAKEIIYQIDEIENVYRTETMISMEESINDKKRLMHKIFRDM